MSDKSKQKRKIVERREAGIKAMPAPRPRTLPQDHPARTMFRQVAEAERDQAEDTTPTTPTTSHHDHPWQKVPVVPVVESASGRGGLNDDNKSGSTDSNTFINTNTDKKDDEAFAGLVEMLKQASRTVTGKDPALGEADRWREIGELLAAELQIAASRTTVSSAPAFLFEHLRRRLRKSDARQIEQEVREASSVQSPPASVKPELDAGQLQEQVNIIASLMNDGVAVRDLEERFAANFRPAQWHMIRSMALAQARSVRTQPPEKED